MSLPTLLVEMSTDDLVSGAALDDDASAVLDTAVLGPIAPTFTEDITPYVRSFNTSRGAQRELQRVEAGTATIELDNRDGRFTPFKPGPYYPNVLPMRQIRIQAIFSAVTYPVFRGFVESWPVEFPEEVDQVSKVQLVDGFKVLSVAAVSGDFPEQGSGARISAVLDAAGWDTAERDIETGLVTVPAITLDNVSALEHIQRVEYAEAGRFFMARDGKATFRDRTVSNITDFSTRTWADDGTGMSYRDVTLIFDDTLIANDVHLTRPAGVEQVVTSGGSQQKYGIRSLVVNDIQLSSDGAVLDLANLFLTRYGEPVLRLEGLVDNAMDHGFWDRVLTRELADVVQAIETRTGTVQISSTEGLRHEAGVDTWIVSLALAPTTVSQGGILDDATYGLLDSTAVLA